MVRAEGDGRGGVRWVSLGDFAEGAVDGIIVVYGGHWRGEPDDWP